MLPLLAWSQDDILAQHSGYHQLARYLQADALSLPRRDATAGLLRWRTRLLRRFSFSRWCTTGSFALESLARQHLAKQPRRLLHFLWCDRDLAFLDRKAARGLRLIGTFHQCADDLPQVIRRPATLRHFSAIVLMSETQRPYFLHQQVPSEKIHMLPHGVDVDHFTPSSLTPPTSFTALSVGGTRRDHHQLRAVVQTFSGQTQIRFVIVGPADQQALFTSFDHVTYHVRISDAELLSLYRQASCFLHLPENATANNGLLEALSCGSPVITQRVGGVPEYLHPDCAILSAPGDTAATVSALLELANQPERQHLMRHAARSHALTHAWPLIAQQTTSLYQSIA